MLSQIQFYLTLQHASVRKQLYNVSSFLLTKRQDSGRDFQPPKTVNSFVTLT